MNYLRIGMLALATFAVAAGAAFAQRPDTRQMSCGEVRSLVANAGAIVLTTGQHTYDRYVSDDRFCERPYVSRSTTVPTRDGQCRVLYCDDPLFELEDRF